MNLKELNNKLKIVTENRYFILTVRFIGWLYVVTFALNTIFFYGEYLYKIPSLLYSIL